MKTVVRVANAGGYWGDDPAALKAQVLGGPIDYLTIDYLAEITMVILQKMREKDPTKGWALDFVPAAAGILPELLSRGIKVVTNAGGVNPQGCADSLARAASRLGLSPRIAVVDGSEIAAPSALTGSLRDAEISSGGLLGRPPDPLARFAEFAQAYAYLGARPIAEALARGADIVVTGRVADASLTLGPLVHELGLAWDDWDRLAAATVAGHVLECGAQATGGNLTDWRAVPRLAAVGYPIAELSLDGSFVVTKHPGTGGAVTRETVIEQLLYEIQDPSCYATPDVTADFTSVALEDLGGDRVRISGVRGVPPPPTLKAGLSFEGGWKAAGTYLLGPPAAREKAEAMAAIFWERTGTAFDETATEILGGEDAFLRLAVRDGSRDKVEAFSRRFASFALSGPPGVTIPGGGRPQVQEVYGFSAGAVARDAVRPLVLFEGERIDVPATLAETRELPSRPPSQPSAPASAVTHSVPLLDLAFARSGDKGDSANIGVAARSAEAYEILRRSLTAERVREVFARECRGEVVRYELPNLHAFNFVLERALGGGGVISLRSDPQGKLFAQRLLALDL